VTDTSRCVQTARVSRPRPSDLYAHPRQLITEATAEFGIHSVVDTCLALLEGRVDFELLPVPVAFVSGVHAEVLVQRGDPMAREQQYWPRVWGARGLRYAWLGYARPGVVLGLRDPAWRVREMSAKVVRQHRLPACAEVLCGRLDDESVRVRVAAVQALGALGGREHARLIAAMDVTDPALRVAVASALRSLRLRLDRPVPG